MDVAGYGTISEGGDPQQGDAVRERRDAGLDRQFVELVVRIAAFYAPGTYDLTKEGSLADAFRILLTYMNNSRGGSKLVQKFNVNKVKGK